MKMHLVILCKNMIWTKTVHGEFNIFIFRPFLRIRAFSVLDTYDEHATSFC
jgi:hypothetical protein